MNDCLFCKIINKEIPAKIVFEDEDILAFNDIAPMAPIHVLIIPKTHFRSLNEVPQSNLLGKILNTAKQLAIELNIATTGYRTVINTEAQGGQTVFHVHLHLLGGKQLGAGLTG